MTTASAAAGLVFAAALLAQPELAAAAEPGGEWAARGRKAVAMALLFAGLGGLAWLGLRADARRDRAWSRRFVGAASPTALGAIRAWVASIALGIVLWEDLPSVALLPPSLAEPRGVMLALWELPGIADALQSAAALRAFSWATAALLALAALGLGTRATLPLATAAYLVFAGLLRAYTHFFHTGLLPLYLLAWLCVTPCGEGLSLDRWRRRRRGEAVPDAWLETARYGWGRYGCWAVVGLSYFAAGLAKLRNGGFAWWDADNLRAHVLHGTLQQTRFFDAQPGLSLAWLPDWVFALLGLGTLALELGMLAVLFSALARRFLPVAIVCMHLGILLLQKILFLDSMLLQLIFYDHSRWLDLRRSEGAGRAEPARPAAGPGWLPAATVTAISLYLASTLVLVEFYPGTSWQMYSFRRKKPEIVYYRAFAVGERGSRVRFRLAECAPVLYDARTVDVMRRPFQGKEVESVDAFVRRCAGRRTALPAGEAPVAVEIERRVWHFGAEPDHPDHGEVSALHRVELDGDRP